MRTAVPVLALIALAACDRDNPDARQVQNGAERHGERAEGQMARAGAAIDDATITARVKSALVADDSVKGLAIDVDTAASVVTLRGAVATDAQRRHAEAVARRSDGVSDVKNELTVKPAA